MFILTVPYVVGMMTNSILQVRNTGTKEFSTTGLVSCQAGIWTQVPSIPNLAPQCCSVARTWFQEKEIRDEGKYLLQALSQTSLLRDTSQTTPSKTSSHFLLWQFTSTFLIIFFRFSLTCFLFQLSCLLSASPTRSQLHRSMIVVYFVHCCVSCV